MPAEPGADTGRDDPEIHGTGTDAQGQRGLTVTYAGFEGESELLESLYKRGLQGEAIAPALYRQSGLLMYWTHECPAPWQTPEWIEQMRGQLRPNAFLRLIENRWVTSESTFVPIECWDACVDPDLSPELAKPSLQVRVGLDASVKCDSTAVVATTFDQKARKVRLVWHKVFQPSPDDPLDFEQTVEKTLLELRRRFCVREVRYDPYQLVAVAQRLTAAGVPMLEFPQSVPNLTEASTNLYEMIKGRNLTAYADEEMRLAVSRCVAIETSRGWRVAKEKASHKIDSIVALAMAALAAVQQGQQVVMSDSDRAFQGRAQEHFHRAGQRFGIDADRLWANGADICDAEDRESAAERVRNSRWSRRVAGW